MNKELVLEILGDITWFMGILILQSHKYDDIATKKDAEIAATMMRDLSNALGFSEDDITAIITYSDNKLNVQIKDEEE
jgi:protoporphyrinogen oxidase